MSLNPGDILANHYRIEVEIGRGAYGRVYRARDIKLDRPVAIKELAKGTDDLGSSQFADYVRRFEREARVQAGFNHPNIVHVYELIQESADRLYLVMEYVDGESLRDALAHRGPLPVDEAVRITSDLLAGLAAVHADPRDIVHRDVKPSNVLLTTTDQAKLADFGLAQVGDESLRSEGGKPHPGTALYMSPEQETTSAYLYPASDLFSVGCGLFEMLTGVPYKRAKKERKGLADLRPDTPSWLGEIVAAALAKDPDDRPKDGAEMGRMLAEAKAKVKAEVQAKAEVEERAQQAAQRKADEEAQSAGLVEQERQRQAAEERAKQSAALQALAEALRKSAEESQERQQAAEAERARQEAERKAQAEAEAARRAKRQQAQRAAGEQAQKEAEARAAARRRATPWAVGTVAILVLIVIIIWLPWAGKVRLRAAPTAVFTSSVGTTSLPRPTETREPIMVPEPTQAPVALAAPTPTEPASASEAPSTATPAPPTLTPRPAAPTPVPLPGFTVKGSSAVNVRSGPGTNYSIIGQLAAGSQHDITGRTVANEWWKFDFNGKQGWVSNQVVQVNAEARAVAVAAAPPSPTALPTSRTESPVIPNILGGPTRNWPGTQTIVMQERLHDVYNVKDPQKVTWLDLVSVRVISQDGFLYALMEVLSDVRPVDPETGDSAYFISLHPKSDWQSSPSLTMSYVPQKGTDCYVYNGSEVVAVDSAQARAGHQGRFIEMRFPLQVIRQILPAAAYIHYEAVQKVETYESSPRIHSYMQTDMGPQNPLPQVLW